ncbi:MAG: type I-U CRISPR-associated protein Cas5/Cas6 [Candidatus Eremiobacteraeota bacterium]|nr:type I-U CRISPR-associated protein Cas5/Cas6 [Candidatus Eremiobacteraeota bacterium]MBC5802642.1 type I-U CRISPR-associated protein Cas5/Cas6 [Candidatus Eremiobacteraeota bacterium]MBC5825119.1 type I-U CRISPR-associated protein Cas5/Cas6 [Candidatus Eremiobacteraeota bacterium]
MIALQIDFVAGQFHANPWDRGTNEGEIEWPPSPWRLLRAIVAGWDRSGAGEQETLLRVLDTFSEAPTYNLPIAASGHTRHYVPLEGVKNATPERTLMLDSFIALERGREHGTQAFVIWRGVELDSEERRLLDRCCAAISHLGRSESWCQVSVADAVPRAQDRYRVDQASRENGEGPIVRRLAPGPSLRGIGLLRALQEPTVDTRRARRTMPLGTAWIEYRLPPDFGWAGEQALQRDSHHSVFPPTILRFAIDPETGVLPPITNGITVAEKMRQAAIKRHSAVSGSPASKRLAGKCEDGSDRREGHDHPFFLPLDLRDRGVVDGLDVWLPAGCTHDEFRALTSISDIWDNVILAGRLAVTYLGRVEPVCASQWSTVTPVILDRFPKRRGAGGAVLVDAPAEQLRRALERRSLPASKIDIWSRRRTIAHRLGGHTRLDAFRRARIGERTVHPVVGATITFDRPVAGPIVVGRLAHFGLGQFRPA